MYGTISFTDKLSSGVIIAIIQEMNPRTNMTYVAAFVLLLVNRSVLMEFNSPCNYYNAIVQTGRLGLKYFSEHFFKTR